MSAAADAGADRADSAGLARRIAAIADGKQADDVVALDMRDLVGYTDFLVICTARNERQAKAIHEEVYQRLKHDDGLLECDFGDWTGAALADVAPFASVRCDQAARVSRHPVLRGQPCPAGSASPDTAHCPGRAGRFRLRPNRE